MFIHYQDSQWVTRWNDRKTRPLINIVGLNLKKIIVSLQSIIYMTIRKLSDH